MTNGNDYIEIEERLAEQIQEDYIKALQDGREEIPDEYKLKWIDLYRQG